MSSTAPTTEATCAVRFDSPYDVVLFGYAEVVLAPDIDSRWVASVARGAIENTVLTAFEPGEDLQPHLDDIATKTSPDLAVELAKLNCQLASLRVVMGKTSLREEAAPSVPLDAAAPPRVASPVATASTDVNATAFGVAPLIDEALPFQDTGAHVPAPAPSASSLPDHEATGATVGVGELRAEDIFPEETPDMSLEQYASLCVERALHPGQDGEVAARYRILTEQALRQLDEQWRGRFAQEGALYQRFQQAYAQYQAWLRQQQDDG